MILGAVRAPREWGGMSVGGKMQSLRARGVGEKESRGEGGPAGARFGEVWYSKAST